MSDTSTLSHLGNQKTKYVFDKPSPELLETFENLHQDTMTVVPIRYIGFTSLCPKTGQPDTAEIIINYIPKEKCVESKSLKLYFMSFRQSGEFMEDITNRFLKDLIALLNPYYIEVKSNFVSRGDIFLQPYVNWTNPNTSGESDLKKIGNALNGFHSMK